MTRTTLRHTPLCAVVLLVAAFSATYHVSAATILVNTPQDGAVGTVPGCTLREAVNAINNQANSNGCTNTGAPFGTSDMIRFIPQVSMVSLSAIGPLNSVALSIQRPMVIAGNGAAITTIAGNGGNGLTLFQNFSSNLTIENLRLRAARVGVLNQAGARATLFQMRLSGFSGRAVVNNGRMQITLVKIDNNPGGGVTNGNLVSVTGLGPPDDCVFDNSCDDEAEPAQSPAQLVIDRSVIEANGPVACAGISNGGGPVQGGLGGQVQSIDGVLVLTRSRIVGNRAGNNKGGGVCNQSTATIALSEISENRAQQGAGIALISPPLVPVVINPQLFTVIKNSTISSNVATIRGGGILVEAGTGPLTIQSSTIAMNSAQGTGFQDGGGMAGSVLPVIFRASVLAGNQSGAPGAALRNCANLQLQGDFNFFPVVNNATCTLTGQNNITTGNVMLFGLAVDSSGRRSHTPTTLSPLVDAIPVVAVNLPICNGSDQREQPRPNEGNNAQPIGCDIGAIER